MVDEPELDDLDFEDDLDGGEGSEKAELDTGELGGDELDEGDDDKVELDLEDAPFLLEEDDDDEDDEDLEGFDDEGGDDEGDDEDDEGAPGEDKKAALMAKLQELLEDKRIVFAGIGALVGVVVLLLALLLWPSGEPEVAEVAPPPPAATEEREVIEFESEEAPPEAQFVVTWEEFWVEHQDSDGQIRFLVAKFSAPTTNEKLAWEMRTKKLQLRDAIFYYLRNKDLTFLSDQNNVQVLKNDLVAVINQYLSNDQLGDILIEEYLVK